MVELPSNPTDQELLSVVDDWIDALVRGEYLAALTMVEHDPYYRWTPALLEAVIAGYGLPEPHPSGTVFRVRPRNSATGGPPARNVDRDTGGAPQIEHSLPLNGEWSDLSATFRVESRGNSSAIVLEEVHVF